MKGKIMRLIKITEAWFTFEEDPDKSRFKFVMPRSGEAGIIDEAGFDVTFEITETDDVEKPEVKRLMRETRKAQKDAEVFQCIGDWETVYGPDGKLMDCTDENKHRFIKESDPGEFRKFLVFFARSMRSLQKTAEEQRKTALGN